MCVCLRLGHGSDVRKVLVTVWHENMGIQPDGKELPHCSNMYKLSAAKSQHKEQREMNWKCITALIENYDAVVCMLEMCEQLFTIYFICNAYRVYFNHQECRPDIRFRLLFHAYIKWYICVFVVRHDYVVVILQIDKKNRTVFDGVMPLPFIRIGTSYQCVLIPQWLSLPLKFITWSILWIPNSLYLHLRVCRCLSAYFPIFRRAVLSIKHFLEWMCDTCDTDVKNSLDLNIMF